MENNLSPFNPNAVTAILPTTPYVVVDIQTKAVVYTTTYANRSAARRFADRKDSAYGAVRFICRLA